MNIAQIPSHPSRNALREIAERAKDPYIFLSTAAVKPRWDADVSFYRVAKEKRAVMLYSDYQTERGGAIASRPTIDYQSGSLRDDFHFGPLICVRTESLRKVTAEMSRDYRHAAFYDARLRLSREGPIVRVPDMLYTVREGKREGQFDYVNPKNREVQKEMEIACSRHLERIGVFLLPPFDATLLNERFDKEVSVIIPVRNRERTIGDAIRSALDQETIFPFNVLVVDNHSTDGTTAVINEWCERDQRVLRLVPPRGSGIGGCWMYAARHRSCGKFAVQLDSDDLYADENVLDKIVDAFYREQCAAVVGSYRLVNDQLQEIPPGIVDHREWTPENGPNNALRVNGFGAPRAFYTPALREVGMPDASYGEDYAAMLAISRKYRVGRIYEPLYLCRRWSGNSDAAQDLRSINARDAYKDTLRTNEMIARHDYIRQHGLNAEQLEVFYERQLETWEETRRRFLATEQLKEKRISCGNHELRVQYNPARVISTTADPSAAAQRPCPLCPAHMPDEQRKARYNNTFDVYVNPFPVFRRHFTVAAREHVPQQIDRHLDDLLSLARDFTAYTTIYNGPGCGASVPDHLHAQLIPRELLPVEQDVALHAGNAPVVSLGDRIADYSRTVVVVQGEERQKVIERLRRAIADIEEADLMYNLVIWNEQRAWRIVVAPRRAHRPREYYLNDGSERVLFSPGSIEMGGVIVATRQEDYDRYDEPLLRRLFEQVSARVRVDEHYRLHHE